MSASERPCKRLRPNSDFSHLVAKRLHTENFASSFPSEYNTFIIQPYWTPQFQDPEVSVPFSTQYGPFIQSENGLYASIQPPETITQPSPDMFCTLLSARGRQSSVGGGKIQPTVGLASPAPVTGSNNVCFPEKCFGFTRGPHQWAESFVALVNPGHEPFNQHDMTHEHMHAVVSLDNGSSTSEKAFIPSENSNSYISDPCPVGNQRHMPMPARERQYEDVFACDGPWLPSHPVLQPTFVQTAQPVTNTQTMMYPGDPSYPAQNSWGQVNYPGEDSIGRYVSLQAYGTQNEGPHLEEGQHSDGSEREDYAVVHSALGHSRRGPFRNPEDRQQTAQTRKDKACIRCKMQRCIPDPENLKGACLTCRKATNIKITKLPCLRYKVTEIRIFKPGQVPGLDWTRRWQDLKIKNISKWDSPDIKVIRTTEGFSSIPLTLEVRKFVPEEGDVLDRFWFTSSGLKKSVSVPPYAIANVDAAQKEYSEYINRGGAEFFNGWLKNKDKLLVRTYSTAIAAANSSDTPEQEAKLLKMVLRLWVAIRITTRSIRICGDETLGMRHDLLDETSPLRGEIPVPPVMGAQIELILIQRIQIPLRKKVLETLQALIVANKPNTWFTIYLCSFILLHNCSMITKYDSGYAKKYGFPGMYARPTEVQDYHTGANVLLAYWHYCNRGSQPFTTGNSAAGFHAMAQLSTYQTELIKDTSLYIEANANKWQSLREERAYGDDFFFVSQLYEDDWQPRISVI